MYYSPGEKGFFPKNLKSKYEKAESWPSDAIEITKEQHDMFLECLNSGGDIVINNGVPIAETIGDKQALVVIKEAAVARIKEEAEKKVSLGVVCSTEDKEFLMDTDWDAPVRLLSAIDSLETAGESTITLVDLNNKQHDGVSLDDARSVVQQVAFNYQNILQTKAALQAEINDVDLEGGLEVAKYKINKIKWP